MKRFLVTSVLIAATVTGASVAEAAAQRGKFTGATTASNPVGFKVNRKHRVVRFYFEGVHLTCTDGDQFDSPTGPDRLQTSATAAYKVKKRKFKISQHDDQAGNGWDVAGKFNKKGSKATGTITIFATFDEANNADPDGSVRCESGPVKFAVKRG
jgi:hypothetical protein